MFDIIGDVHGNAQKLKLLLTKMGYSLKNGNYKHPERTALFVGDLIDRGDEIIETLHIVRSMVENNAAIAVMGNHEYNALCFHTQNNEGLPLRLHIDKNIEQHKKTLEAFIGKNDEWRSYLNWFMELPIYFENEHLRVVHACWDNEFVQLISGELPNNRINNDFLHRSVVKGSKEYTAVDTLLKGKEMYLPDGQLFVDKDGISRKQIRYKWWENKTNATYKSLSVTLRDYLPETPIDSIFFDDKHYTPNEKPVFFGHYWLEGTPQIFTHNVCCVDYSVANKGKLLAYRYDGEKQLSNQKFIWVN